MALQACRKGLLVEYIQKDNQMDSSRFLVLLDAGKVRMVVSVCAHEPRL